MELPESVIRVVFSLEDAGAEKYDVENGLWDAPGVMEVDWTGSPIRKTWIVTYSLHEEGDDLKAVEAKLLSVIRGE